MTPRTPPIPAGSAHPRADRGRRGRRRRDGAGEPGSAGGIVFAMPPVPAAIRVRYPHPATVVRRSGGCVAPAAHHSSLVVPLSSLGWTPRRRQATCRCVARHAPAVALRCTAARRCTRCATLTSASPPPTLGAGARHTYLDTRLGWLVPLPPRSISTDGRVARAVVRFVRRSSGRESRSSADAFPFSFPLLYRIIEYLGTCVPGYFTFARSSLRHARASPRASSVSTPSRSAAATSAARRSRARPTISLFSTRPSGALFSRACSSPRARTCSGIEIGADLLARAPGRFRAVDRPGEDIHRAEAPLARSPAARSPSLTPLP